MRWIALTFSILQNIKQNHSVLYWFLKIKILQSWEKQSFYHTLHLIPLNTFVVFADTFHGLKNTKNVLSLGNNTENSLLSYWFSIWIIGFPFKELVCAFEADMPQYFRKHEVKLPLLGPHENTLSIMYRYLARVENVPYF